MSVIDVQVIGVPVAQGSMVRWGPRIAHSNDKELKTWRYAVISEIAAATPIGWDASKAVEVTATFKYQRPKSHYGTGRNSKRLLDSAPKEKITTPDLDKLVRAVGDAIQQSGILRSDGQIVYWNAGKRYVYDGELPGLDLRIIGVPWTSLIALTHEQ
mgnify:CR=1 FL=1|tara:strand:- start:48 stop:518 length:471 start_codon:yes stop_codon:yes gene_type:complete